METFGMIIFTAVAVTCVVLFGRLAWETLTK